MKANEMGLILLLNVLNKMKNVLITAANNDYFGSI